MDTSQNKTQEDIDNAPVTYKEFHEAMALVATKDDLKRFATKDDFFRLERRIGNIEATMSTKEDINNLTNIVEKVFKKYTDYEIEETTHAQVHNDIQEKLGEHEQRIVVMETVIAGLA